VKRIGLSADARVVRGVSITAVDIDGTEVCSDTFQDGLSQKFCIVDQSRFATEYAKFLLREMLS
jgi:hypothetical protein